MSEFIYLYGKGETNNGVRTTFFEKCFLKCEIPDSEYKEENGFFPSVLHSYVMYAKDIGLTITDIIYENPGALSKENLVGKLHEQLVYSLWPILYVNNSEAFTSDTNRGIPVWFMDSSDLNFTVLLNTSMSFFYMTEGSKESFPDLKAAEIKDNRIPAPDNLVQATGPWYLDLTIPDGNDSGDQSSTYSIVKHYNELVIWNTLININSSLKTNKLYSGIKGAMGILLQIVMDRKYADMPILPRWSGKLDEKPNWYDDQRTAQNNYNIGAAFFLYEKGKDPHSSETDLFFSGIALNIKGIIKAGHAEMRLLLTFDAMNYEQYRNNWMERVIKFYGFEGIRLQNIYDTIRFISQFNILLISSLKPCYMCAGEVEASVSGFIETINDMPVKMWSDFPYTPLFETVKEVIYFDIDKPIKYPAKIISISFQGAKKVSQWDLELSEWDQWAAFLKDNQAGYLNPIGPRIVEPAGECLKNGYSYSRYKNSAKLLLTDQKTYLSDLNFLLSGTVTEVEK